MQNNGQDNILFTTTSTKLFAEIIIPLALPETYIWEIPSQYISTITLGMRVEVQLRNK